MTDKKKPHTAGTGTASRTSFDNRNSIAPDPLKGWFDLAKPSCNRQQKRGWKRSQRGQIDMALAGQLVMLLVVLVMIVAGVAA